MKIIFLFIDVKDYTDMVMNIGDRMSLEIIQERLENIKKNILFNLQKPIFIRRIADELLFCWESSDDVLITQIVGAVINAQLLERNRVRDPDKAFLPWRAGMSYGYSHRLEDGDFHSLSVIIGSRLQSNASPGGILIDDNIYRAINAQDKKLAEDFYRIPGYINLKGLSKCIAFYWKKGGPPGGKFCDLTRIKTDHDETLVPIIQYLSDCMREGEFQFPIIWIKSSDCESIEATSSRIKRILENEALTYGDSKGAEFEELPRFGHQKRLAIETICGFMKKIHGEDRLLDHKKSQIIAIVEKLAKDDIFIQSLQRNIGREYFGKPSLSARKIIECAEWNNFSHQGAFYDDPDLLQLALNYFGTMLCAPLLNPVTTFSELFWETISQNRSQHLQFFFAGPSIYEWTFLLDWVVDAHHSKKWQNHVCMILIDRHHPPDRFRNLIKEFKIGKKPNTIEEDFIPKTSQVLEAIRTKNFYELGILAEMAKITDSPAWKTSLIKTTEEENEDLQRNKIKSLLWEILSDPSTTRTEVAISYYQLGRLASEENDHDSSIKYNIKSAASDPNYISPKCALALSLYRRKKDNDLIQSEKICLDILAKHKNHVRTLEILMMVQWAQGRIDDARKTAQTASKLPNSKISANVFKYVL